MTITLKILIGAAAISVAIWCTIYVGTRTHHWLTAPSDQELAHQRADEEWSKRAKAGYNECIRQHIATERDLGFIHDPRADTDCWGTWLAAPPPVFVKR